MKTLEEILEIEKKRRNENGIFGIKACKEEIKDEIARGKSLYTQLEEYVELANEDPLFNNRMVLACWELINRR